MMIPFNLNEEKHKNHPNDDKHGVIVSRGDNSGYPVTIVDNVTKERRILTLVHLSPSVRKYSELELYHEVLYLSGRNQDTYRMFDYEKQVISSEDAVKTLREIFYKLEPNLHERSLVGSSKKGIENDPNYYVGHYVLNDEETYSILKCRDTVRFFKGKKDYYPDFDSEEGLLASESIDFELYALSLEYEKCKRKIVYYTNLLLDTDKLIETTLQLKELESKIDSMI